MSKTVKEALSCRLPALVFALIAVQPLLDVLSFFLGELGSNALSTLLRFALMAAVGLLGFFTSDRKRLYVLFYALAGVFWLIHMANCFRIGYQSVVEDAANFLRIVSYLVFTLSLATFFRKGRRVRRAVLAACGLNFLFFWVFTLLPWVLGRPQYTYSELFVGMMGWFSIPNAQSTILVLTAPFALYWAYSREKYPLFLIMTALCFGLFYATGTKLTFYAIFVIAFAYIFLFALQLGKGGLRYILPMAAVVVLAAVFLHQSPMALRERMSAYSRDLNDQQVEQTLQENSADKDAIEDAQNSKKKQPEATMEEIHRGLFYVYTDKEENGLFMPYGYFFEDMNQRFGLYRVMEAYGYSTTASTLSDFRVMKSLFSQMVWEEKDLCTRLLGYEYSEVVVGGTIYDLENDFPAIYYFFGYMGFALYMLVFLYMAFVVVRALGADVARAMKELPPVKGPRQKRLALGLWQGLRRFLTIETGAAGMAFLLAILAAQISGYVLRRPNVTIYFAVSTAYLLHLCTDLRPELTEQYSLKKLLHKAIKKKG